MELPDITRQHGVQDAIHRALEEDISIGDISSELSVPADLQAHAEIVACGSYIVSGLDVVAAVFKQVHPSTRVTLCVQDGDRVSDGEAVCKIAGLGRVILAGERTALNFLQRMSGIATMTRTYVHAASGYKVQILDTRKTTPTLRAFEKYAVLCGGGTNHRFGLFDRVMLKDNHLALAERQGKSLNDVVRAAREHDPEMLVEIEVDDEAAFDRAVAAEPDWILLDNMDVATLTHICEKCHGRCKLEASGGVTLEDIAGIAASGVDAISVGGLTHSAPSADFSLEVTF